MLRLRELAARHLLPAYRRQMVAACAAAEPRLRENSFAVLSAAKDLAEVDVLAYHAWTVGYKAASLKTRAASADYVKANAGNEAEKKRVAAIFARSRAGMDARRYTDRKILAVIEEILKSLGVAAPAEGNKP
jgi:hypothetical protein